MIDFAGAAGATGAATTESGTAVGSIVTALDDGTTELSTDTDGDTGVAKSSSADWLVVFAADCACTPTGIKAKRAVAHTIRALFLF